MLREGDLVPQDIGERRVAVFTFERGSAEQHFVDEDAQCPPINGACVTVAFDHFWCNILFGANERIRSEVGYARLGVDQRITGWIRAVSTSEDHGWSSSSVRLFGQVEI